MMDDFLDFELRGFSLVGDERLTLQSWFIYSTPLHGGSAMECKEMGMALINSCLSQNQLQEGLEDKLNAFRVHAGEDDLLNRFRA